MQTRLEKTVFGLILLFCVVNAAVGWWMNNDLLTTASIAGTCYVLLRIAYNRRLAKRRGKVKSVTVKPAVAEREDNPSDPDNLIQRMLYQGRFALLLRAQVAGNMTAEQFDLAMEALGDGMSLVPDGEVVLGQLDDALDDGELEDEEIAAARGRKFSVQAFFLDRYPVTNRQYQEFVAAGGYEQMPLWDESALAAVLDFVDCTGTPGPRYWKNGLYELGEEDLPVVGISWYEASAYARWVGKRLPSDAEWVKAGAWPVPLSDNSRVQRKFPWGDTMDRSRTNLWGSGPEKIVPVDQFPLGVSVGGVHQLIGNVWEWTCGHFQSGTFQSGNHSVDELVISMPLKSIRGGAFDTYFDNQATCQFQSGENPLHRRHNIGFRCAVAVTDLALRRPEEELPEASAAPAEQAREAETPVAACALPEGQTEPEADSTSTTEASV